MFIFRKMQIYKFVHSALCRQTLMQFVTLGDCYYLVIKYKKPKETKTYYKSTNISASSLQFRVLLAQSYC